MCQNRSFDYQIFLRRMATDLAIGQQTKGLYYGTDGYYGTDISKAPHSLDGILNYM